MTDRDLKPQEKKPEFVPVVIITPEMIEEGGRELRASLHEYELWEEDAIWAFERALLRALKAGQAVKEKP